MGKYAIYYSGSVEYGMGWPKRNHYSWSANDRAKFTEKQLADALNKAYEAGYKGATMEMKALLAEMRGLVK